MAEEADRIEELARGKGYDLWPAQIKLLRAVEAQRKGGPPVVIARCHRHGRTACMEFDAELRQRIDR